MARTRQTRKRSGGPLRRAPFKRRRNYRRSRGRKRETRVISTNGDLHPISYKARKLGKKRYRAALWRDTLCRPHYNTSLVRYNTLATGASYNTWSVTDFWMLDGTTSSTDMFWTLAGGFFSQDKDITAGTFKGDIIIRGGQLNFKIFNNTETADANNDSVEVYFALFCSSDGFDNSYLTSILPGPGGLIGNADLPWRVGTLMVQKRFVLKDGEGQSVSVRLKPRKVDQAAWINGHRKYVGYLAIKNCWTATAQTCVYNFGHDVSFTGDLIT